jgi:hypothetical protein
MLPTSELDSVDRRKEMAHDKSNDMYKLSSLRFSMFCPFSSFGCIGLSGNRVKFKPFPHPLSSA